MKDILSADSKKEAENENTRLKYGASKAEVKRAVKVALESKKYLTIFDLTPIELVDFKPKSFIDYISAETLDFQKNIENELLENGVIRLVFDESKLPKNWDSVNNERTKIIKSIKERFEKTQANSHQEQNVKNEDDLKNIINKMSVEIGCLNFAFNDVCETFKEVGNLMADAIALSAKSQNRLNKIITKLSIVLGIVSSVLIIESLLLISK